MRASILAFCTMVAACSAPEESEEESVTPAAVTPKDTCAAGEEKTGRDYAVRDEIVLREAPNEAANPILKPGLAADDKDRPVYATITSSVPVRETCRSGIWSKVRVLVTEELRWMSGWVPSAALREVPVGEGRRRIYGSGDIEWQPGSERYRKQILAVVNKVMREDKRCDAIDSQSLLVDNQGGDPRFTILCVGPAGTHDITFEASDGTNGRSFAQEAVNPGGGGEEPIGKVDAVTACEEAITQQLSQPKTADFHTFTDTTYHTDGSRARVTIGFRANNGFGNPIDATAECVFEGTTLSSAALIP